MKVIKQVLIAVVGLALVGLLVFAAVKATVELTQVISAGIGNMYTVGE